MGHSLGSAILFDILCRQKENTKIHGSAAHQRHDRNRPSASQTHKRDLEFYFDVEDFYCLGSPIGLFQMLKGRTISGRHQPEALPAESPMDPDYMQDPFLAAGSASGFGSGENISSTTGLPLTISSPKCAQVSIVSQNTATRCKSHDSNLLRSCTTSSTQQIRSVTAWNR
jgi:hypothetical protein